MSSPKPENHHTIEVRLDAKGLNCPLPILKAKFALNTMHPGQLLQVEATDPHSVIDFEAYCARTGHSILSTTHTSNGVIEFIIQRAESPKPV
ncbi:MAG: sulfurtransferase TusA family protein [Gammaproteobacteria bacterium]|jgi:tRNA 2-thiouridine synthesizing protein A|nr:MAG: sulfurtransferase TusA family protein [Gammaproteobacteria bacterium]